MGFLRTLATQMLGEARQLRTMGLNSCAKEREEEAELYYRLADEVEQESVYEIPIAPRSA